MSQQALLALAREATVDLDALIRIQSLSDEDLLRRGLDTDEVEAVRRGFFERLAQAGSFGDDGWRSSGCCGE